MLLVRVTEEPVAGQKKKPCQVAINLMNTCRVIIKDMFTFSREKASDEDGSLDFLLVGISFSPQGLV